MANSSKKVSKLQHLVTRTRVLDCKLLDFGVVPRPLWIRRVLVRAYEGNAHDENRGRLLGLGLAARAQSLLRA
jgi:hypothetical protein